MMTASAAAYRATCGFGSCFYFSQFFFLKMRVLLKRIRYFNIIFTIFMNACAQVTK